MWLAARGGGWSHRLGDWARAIPSRSRETFTCPSLTASSSHRGGLTSEALLGPTWVRLCSAASLVSDGTVFHCDDAKYGAPCHRTRTMEGQQKMCMGRECDLLSGATVIDTPSRYMAGMCNIQPVELFKPRPDGADALACQCGGCDAEFGRDISSPLPPSGPDPVPEVDPQVSPGLNGRVTLGGGSHREMPDAWSCGQRDDSGIGEPGEFRRRNTILDSDMPREVGNGR